MLAAASGSRGGVGESRLAFANRGTHQFMAQRPRQKVKRPTGRAKAAAPSAPVTPETRVKALEQERDALKRELEVARQRIAALEESRSVVANRIDWIIESLTNVVDRGG